MEELHIPQYELLDMVEPDPNAEHGSNTEEEMDVDSSSAEENHA